MAWFIGFAVIVVLAWWLLARSKPAVTQADLSVLPEQFVIYDLETTGLDANRHEIIEIGAIRVNRDSDEHQTFQTLVKPTRRVPKKITTLTGITNEMVQSDGLLLTDALPEFRKFVGDLPLVAYNAEFDDAFLQAACASTASAPFMNETCCALRLARRAWPERSSFRLVDLARDGNLLTDGTHRALADCRLTMTVYCAAASVVRAYR